MRWCSDDRGDGGDIQSSASECKHLRPERGRTVRKWRSESFFAKQQWRCHTYFGKESYSVAKCRIFPNPELNNHKRCFTIRQSSPEQSGCAIAGGTPWTAKHEYVLAFGKVLSSEHHGFVPEIARYEMREWCCWIANSRITNKCLESRSSATVMLFLQQTSTRARQKVRPRPLQPRRCNAAGLYS